jgi:hypothetical protein
MFFPDDLQRLEALSNLVSRSIRWHRRPHR